jgi:hypothetical protein
MPIISECSYPGCGVKTIGPLCIAHDLPVVRSFPRGRAPDPALTRMATATVSSLNVIGRLGTVSTETARPA